MAKDASEVLGATELAGCFVSPKGLTKKVTGATAAGMVAGVAGRAVVNATVGAEGAPSFGSLGYVAVTPIEVAIVSGKTGAFKPSVGTAIIARVGRDQITSVTLDGGMLKAALKIGFADGGTWEFEIPKVHRKGAELVVQALNCGQR